MALRDVLPEGPLRRFLQTGSKSKDEITIGDLEQEFGEEAVKRGVAYMASLAEAEENFKESAEGRRLKEGFVRAGVKGEEQLDKAGEKWEEAMENSGLGLSEDQE